MQFGRKKSEVVETSGNGNYLRNFPKGETYVRFLDELDDWTAFYEHFNTDGRSFPCTEEKTTCPGCTSTNEKLADRRRKYAALVWNVKKDSVMPYRIPITVADRMTVRAERNGGTITTRDYVVLKSGAGIDTEYDVDQETRYEVNLADLRGRAACSVQEALADAFKENAPHTEIPPQRTRTRERKEELPVDPPTEPAAQQQSGAQVDEDAELTEAQVRAMNKADLRTLCERSGVAFEPSDTRQELADRLIAVFGE